MSEVLTIEVTLWSDYDGHNVSEQVIFDLLQTIEKLPDVADVHRI